MQLGFVPAPQIYVSVHYLLFTTICWSFIASKIIKKYQKNVEKQQFGHFVQDVCVSCCRDINLCLVYFTCYGCYVCFFYILFSCVIKMCMLLHLKNSFQSIILQFLLTLSTVKFKRHLNSLQCFMYQDKIKIIICSLLGLKFI